MLALFYERRVAELRSAQAQQPQQQLPTSQGPDANGVYHVGGPIKTPTRLVGPKYPPEALAAGVEGTVITEVVIDAISDSFTPSSTSVKRVLISPLHQQILELGFSRRLQWI